MNDDDEIAFIWAGSLIAATAIVGLGIAAAVVFAYLDLDAW